MRYLDFTDLIACISWIATKNPVKKFEEQFANYIGIPHVLATSFGRTALYLGLKSLDVRNREVIIPTFICTVVRHAVVMAGAKPVFADISYDTFGYDLDDIRKKINKKTIAIVITHYFGMLAPNIDDIVTLARENGIFIIEDCAHALGASYKNYKIGTIGDCSIYSLTKNTLNFGGGVLATHNKRLFQTGQEILQNENFPFRKTLLDFPLNFSYGLEQVIDKTVFDRVGKSIFKWWLIKLPLLLLKLRSLLITAFTFRVKSKNIPYKASSKSLNSGDNLDEPKQYQFPLSMNRITASVASNQLNKLDYLTEKRRQINDKIAPEITGSIHCYDKYRNTSSHAFIALKFNTTNISHIIDKCRKKGLLLRSTWPTHQKLWKEQDTKTVRRIEREILTWNVNPMITTKEIRKFIDIVNNISTKNL